MPVQLFDYQLDAVKRIKNGSLVCGGVGSGKSLTSLAYYYKFNGGTIDKDGYLVSDMFMPQDLYVITTAHKRDTLEWHSELKNIRLYPNGDTQYYKNKVVVDSWNNITKYKNVTKAFFIFDEQRVVGYGTWSKTFIKIARNNNWILLSATPGDCWSDYIPVFIANGFYRNKKEFEMDHVVYNPHVPYKSISKYIGTKKLERLRADILINMDFVRKTNSHIIKIHCNYDKALYKEITKLRADPREMIDIDGVLYPKPYETASSYCMALRKVSTENPSRGIEVLNILKTHDRAIIFYQFDYELEILETLPYDSDVVINEWNGHRHDPVPDSKKWVYLVQYSAGAEGWNCITTNCMIFYSLCYSYRNMTQAMGRIDRLNTPYTDLYYYELVCTSNIEIAIRTALNNKKDFNISAFSKKKGINNENRN